MYVKNNQLEKLEAARSAYLWLPFLALLVLTGPNWALLGLIGPYWALFCICALTNWLTSYITTYWAALAAKNSVSNFNCSYSSLRGSVANWSVSPRHRTSLLSPSLCQRQVSAWHPWPRVPGLAASEGSPGQHCWRWLGPAPRCSDQVGSPAGAPRWTSRQPLATRSRSMDWHFYLWIALVSKSSMWMRSLNHFLMKTFCIWGWYRLRWLTSSWAAWSRILLYLSRKAPPVGTGHLLPQLIAIPYLGPCNVSMVKSFEDQQDKLLQYRYLRFGWVGLLNIF